DSNILLFDFICLVIWQKRRTGLEVLINRHIGRVTNLKGKRTRVAGDIPHTVQHFVHFVVPYIDYSVVDQLVIDREWITGLYKTFLNGRYRCLVSSHKSKAGVAVYRNHGVRRQAVVAVSARYLNLLTGRVF